MKNVLDRITSRLNTEEEKTRRKDITIETYLKLTHGEKKNIFKLTEPASYGNMSTCRMVGHICVGGWEQNNTW